MSQPADAAAAAPTTTDSAEALYAFVMYRTLDALRERFAGRDDAAQLMAGLQQVGPRAPAPLLLSRSPFRAELDRSTKSAHG